jgi:hypothetical protein
MKSRHLERHSSGRTGWLHATVLGANDGIVSIASLIVGVATADVTHKNVLIAGVAGLVAGASSTRVATTPAMPQRNVRLGAFGFQCLKISAEP